MVSLQSDQIIRLLEKISCLAEDGVSSDSLDVRHSSVSELLRLLEDLRDEIALRTEETKRLFRLAEEINSGVSLKEMLDRTYQSFRELIPYDRIGYSLIESKHGQEYVRALWCRSESDHFFLNNGYTARLLGSSLEQIIATGEPRILNDLEQYLREHPGSDSTSLIVKEGLKSSLTCPLVAKGKAIGFLFFSSREKDSYINAHVEIFSAIANQLSLITEKSLLLDQLVELNSIKSKFLGMAAHDLRNPLIVIEKYLEFFLAGTIGNISETEREPLLAMQRSCTRMFRLINGLLDVNAIDSGALKLEKENVNIGQLIAECVSLNRISAQSKSIELVTELEEDLPAVSLDPNRISQVIDNLVSNAIKFSHSESSVTIRVSCTAEEILISVVDQGQGISPDEMPKLFSDFGRTSTRPTAGESSTGLGLAICRRIVEAHKGRIWAESNYGAGCMFFVALPIL